MSFELITYCFQFILCVTVIVGAYAEIAKIQNHPHQVLLKFNGIPFCGGSIVSTRHVLTAAHCLAGKSKNYPNMAIYAGTTYSKEKADPIYKIYRVDIHPKFNGKLIKPYIYLYDIAVVTLKEIIIFSDTRKKIELTSEDVHSGSFVSLSGWGVTSYSQKAYSKDLLSNKLLIINNSKCSAILSYNLHSDQFCTFSKEAIKQCPGDSGGPVVSNGKLVGVASHAVICQKDVPDVYTSIYHSLRFIRAIIGS